MPEWVLVNDVSARGEHKHTNTRENNKKFLYKYSIPHRQKQLDSIQQKKKRKLFFTVTQIIIKQAFDEPVLDYIKSVIMFYAKRTSY